MSLCSYVIARSDCICCAVAIPRKGSSRLSVCIAKTLLHVAVQCCPHLSMLMVCPRSAATPTAHPRRVQQSTRNEICLAANEILLRKVKSHFVGLWSSVVQIGAIMSSSRAEHHALAVWQFLGNGLLHRFVTAAQNFDFGLQCKLQSRITQNS